MARWVSPARCDEKGEVEATDGDVDRWTQALEEAGGQYEQITAATCSGGDLRGENGGRSVAIPGYITDFGPSMTFNAWLVQVLSAAAARSNLACKFRAIGRRFEVGEGLIL